MEPQTRKPTGVRRREIAQAVLRVIGDHGAPALTTARIASEVGVTSGALFRHFESIETMLDAAVDRAIEAVDETFPAAELPAIVRLRDMAQGRIELIGGNRGLAWLLLSDQVYLTASERSVAHLRALVTRSRRYLLGALREGAANGTIRTDIAPEKLLMIFTGTVHAAIGSVGVHRAPEAGPDVLDALFTLISPTP